MNHPSNELAVWREHSGRTAWPTVALSIAIAALYAADWWLVLTGRIGLVAGFAASLVLSYLAFTPLHEAVHGNIGGGRKGRGWLDPLFGWISGTILLAPYPAFKVVHLRHHSHTNDLERDPDAWVAGANAITIALRCLTIVPHYYHDFLLRMRLDSPALSRMRRATLAALAAQATAIAALAAAGLGLEVLCLWVAPALLASGLLAFLFEWVPHVPHASRERYHDTRVVLAPGLAPLMTWQNYHLVHHLYPRIPFYRYGTAFHEMRRDLEAKGAEIVEV